MKTRWFRVNDDAFFLIDPPNRQYLTPGTLFAAVTPRILELATIEYPHLVTEAKAPDEPESQEPVVEKSEVEVVEPQPKRRGRPPKNVTALSQAPNDRSM